MTERTDIGNKLGDSLKGWEFTPAMKQQVLQRAKMPEARPGRPALRTVAWSAFVAAAAFAIAINLTRYGGLEGNRDEVTQLSLPGQEAMPQTPMPAPAEVTQDSGQRAMGASGESVPGSQRESAQKMAAPDSPLSPLPISTRTGHYEQVSERAGSNSLMAVQEDSALVAAGSGPGFAVASGAQVMLYDGAGNPLRQYVIAGGQVTGLEVVSQDGPIAAGVDRQQVQLFGAHEMSVPGRSFALSPTDGAMAVSDGQRVSLYRQGQVVWQREFAEASEELLFAGDNLVTGSVALDPATGDVRWTHLGQGRPEGLSADVFVRWGEEVVTAFRTADGSSAWGFSAPEGHRITDAAGNAGRLAILARHGEGAVLWVTDASARVLYVAGFAEPVEGVAVTGAGRVLLLLPGGKVGAVPASEIISQ